MDGSKKKSRRRGSVCYSGGLGLFLLAWFQRARDRYLPRMGGLDAVSTAPSRFGQGNVIQPKSRKFCRTGHRKSVSTQEGTYKPCIADPSLYLGQLSWVP